MTQHAYTHQLEQPRLQGSSGKGRAYVFVLVLVLVLVLERLQAVPKVISNQWVGSQRRTSELITVSLITDY